MIEVQEEEAHVEEGDSNHIMKEDHLGVEESIIKWEIKDMKEIIMIVVQFEDEGVIEKILELGVNSTKEDPVTITKEEQYREYKTTETRGYH